MLVHSVNLDLQLEILSSQSRNSKFTGLKSFLVVGWVSGGGSFDYSVNSWPRFDKVKARFSHVCDYVSQG